MKRSAFPNNYAHWVWLSEIMAVKGAFPRQQMGKKTYERLKRNSTLTPQSWSTSRSRSLQQTDGSLVWIDGRPQQPISARRAPKPYLFHFVDQSETSVAAECVTRAECECGLLLRSSHPPSRASNGGRFFAALSFSCSACKSHVYKTR